MHIHLSIELSSLVKMNNSTSIERKHACCERNGHLNERKPHSIERKCNK